MQSNFVITGPKKRRDFDSETMFSLSKWSQYGLKRYANGPKWHANGVSTASVAGSVLCPCVWAIFPVHVTAIANIIRGIAVITPCHDQCHNYTYVCDIFAGLRLRDTGTSCSEMFIYARARDNHHSHLQRACECGRSQVAKQRPF